MSSSVDKHHQGSETSFVTNVHRLILETDPPTIASRVSMRGAESDIPLTDRVTEVCLYSNSCRQSHLGTLSERACQLHDVLLQVNIQSFLATAKEQLARSLLK